MDKSEQKQLERQRRDRLSRIWLTRLSWTTPILAFASFFSIWHQIGAIPNASAHTAVKQQTTAQSSHILFQPGSQSQQVSIIQEQLAQLGYFNHAITQYYGPVTSHAVAAFQTARSLPATGKIDDTTLRVLQKAVKGNMSRSLAQSNSSSSSSSTTGSFGVSQQQSSSVGTSSAS